MTRRKRKTAEESAFVKRVQDLEAVNLPVGMAALKTGESIEVTRAGGARAGRKVEADSARRLDAFEALKAGMVDGAYDAARKFERDLLESRREGDRGFLVEKVQQEATKEREFKFIIAAGNVREVKGQLAPRDWRLLMELIAPEFFRGTWRDHVAYVTGEKQFNAQGAVVRSLCVNVRDAYAAIERRTAA